MRIKSSKSLIMGEGASLAGAFSALAGRALLFCITAIPTLAIVFMIFYIAGESMPFLLDLKHAIEFFTSTKWNPSAEHPSFGALTIFYGTAMITIGSCAIAIPVGISAAVCLNEIVGEKTAKIVKPAIELLAAVPSVVYGFFAIVIFAPLLQDKGGLFISGLILLAGIPISIVGGLCVGEIISDKIFPKGGKFVNVMMVSLFMIIFLGLVLLISNSALSLKITSGTNALNASIILAIMALPTIVSISQDALSSVGRDMLEGSLALGATRAETIFKVLLPCAKSGISVAIILGLMRVFGETMVVWMASGNALKIPEPFYNFLEPVRTMTATIAGEMGEADQSTGSVRYHALFAISFCLLVGALIFNAVGQWVGAGFKISKK